MLLLRHNNKGFPVELCTVANCTCQAHEKSQCLCHEVYHIVSDMC